MFDSQVGGPDAATTLSLVSTAHRLVLDSECRLVELAAHWADLHHPDSQARVEWPRPGAERGRRLGGEGTPDVLEFAAAEFGARLETSSGSARALMANALDLRHRLPELWQLILTGGVPAWKARKAAQATRHLSRDAAMQVDAAVARAITGLPWARFETLLTAKIIEADPHAADEQAKIWEAERFVRAGRTNQSGLKLLIGKANAGDVTWCMATVNRLAEILRLQGDMESVDVRQSKAIGILAQPALALQLLWEFRNEQRPRRSRSKPTTLSTTSRRRPVTGPLPHRLMTSRLKPMAHRKQKSHRRVRPGRGLTLRPSGVDLDKLRPKVILHIHLSEEALASYQCSSRFGGGVARMEGVGPVTLGQAQRFLADTKCEVRVQPVIDPQDTPRWMVMRFRAGSGKRCFFACRPAAFLTPPTPDVWNWIRPSRTNRRLRVGRPAKPRSTSSVR